MDVLEISQVEALIFNYASFGFFTTINSFWTLVAVLTAAISFWRIRAVGSILDKPDDGTPSFYNHEKPSQESIATLLEEEDDDDKEEGHQVCSCSSSSFDDYGSVIDDGTVKGKFMVHYYKEEDNGVNYNDEEDELTVTRNWKDDKNGVLFTEVYVNWDSSLTLERILQVKRTGDLGWYGNQDLTSLNGSVVKLWGRY